MKGSNPRPRRMGFDLPPVRRMTVRRLRRGCVTYGFDFPAWSHIGLMEDLQGVIALLARRQLRLELEHELDADLAVSGG